MLKIRLKKKQIENEIKSLNRELCSLKSWELTDSQRDELETTALVVLSFFERSHQSGMSRPALSSTIIWISLLYHSVRISFPQMALMLSISESTLGNQKNRITNSCLFRIVDEASDYGYLDHMDDTVISPVLLKLGKAKAFDENNGEVFQRVKRELDWIAVSSPIPEISASKLLAVKLLLGGEALTKDAIISHIDKMLSNSRRSERDRDDIKKNSTEIPFTSTIVESKHGSFNIREDLRRYVKKLFGSFDLFISRCVMGQWDSRRCENGMITLAKSENIGDTIEDIKTKAKSYQVFEELVKITGSSNKPEYIASRLFATKLLLNEVSLSEQEIRQKIKATVELSSRDKEETRRIDYYSVRFLNVRVGYFDEFSPIVKRKGEGFYIPAETKQLIREHFDPFDTFVTRCILKRWDEKVCKNELEELFKTLGLTKQIMGKIALPDFKKIVKK